MALGIDLSRYNPNDVDNIGDIPPAGKYHVRLDGAARTRARGTNREGTELSFVLLVGRNKGYTVKETLWDGGDDDAKTQKAHDRTVRFAKRLGLIVVKGDALEYAEGKHDFSDVIGAEAIIKIKHEDWERDGKKGTACRMEMFGIWSVDDPECKDVPKATGGGSTAAPVPSSASRTTPAPAKKMQFDPNEL
jgi:hypothetical protein